MTAGLPNSMRHPLEPIGCTRCDRDVDAATSARPAMIRSWTYRPLDPRPRIGGHDVDWVIDDDYEQNDRAAVSAVLCSACLTSLAEWLYLAS